MTVSKAAANKQHGGVGVPVSNKDISSADAPSLAELDAEFGDAAVVGFGFIGILNDNGASNNSVLCWSDGAEWFYAAGTKAS